ncbi:MAG: hypothetical protein IJ608_07380 [Lachnospiraceae bacterium]|nr:hypothetical protein [Lachnospiraceae bacterium]
MGKNGEYNALGLYIGEEGFGSYRVIANAGYTGSEFKDHELLLKQRCLQLALEGKEDLLPDEVTEVRDYAKKNGIKLSGKNAYPQFIKYEPDYHPWKVKTEDDMESLYEAASAAILLAEELEKTSPAELGIDNINQFTAKVPLFEVKGDKLIASGLVDLPGDLEEKYDYVKADNEILLASVKKLPKKGIWETELLRMMEPVQDDPEEAPYYPLLLLVVESKSGYMLPVPMVSGPEIDQQELLQEYVKGWKMQGCYPKELRCRDERTYALLKDICEKTEVKVRIYEKEMPMLDEAEEALLEDTLGDDPEEAMNQFADIIDMILNMSKSELKMIPKPMIEELKMMMDHDIFPNDIATELKEKLKGI